MSKNDKFMILIDVAKSEFSKNGYHGARIIQIATRCGMSKAGIYHYIESKEKLAEACVLDVVEKIKTLRNKAREEVKTHTFIAHFCLLGETFPSRLVRRALERYFHFLNEAFGGDEVEHIVAQWVKDARVRG